MTLRRKVIPVEFQIKPFVRQMKSPRPPRMAGRRAAILLIRLVAPCASESGLVSVGPASVARVRSVDPLNRRFAFCFFVSRHPEPHLSLSPRRVRAPGSCSLLRGVSCAAHLPSPAAFRGAAGLLLFLRPPREGWAERREAHQRTVAPAKRDHRVSETRAVPGDGTAPVGAPPWRFTDRATTRHVSDSASDHAAPSRGRPHGQPFGSRGLPAAVAPRCRDATPRSASERLRRRPSRARMGRI
jgi:hypothetical protein